MIIFFSYFTCLFINMYKFSVEIYWICESPNKKKLTRYLNFANHCVRRGNIWRLLGVRPGQIWNYSYPPLLMAWQKQVKGNSGYYYADSRPSGTHLHRSNSVPRPSKDAAQLSISSMLKELQTLRKRVLQRTLKNYALWKIFSKCVKFGTKSTHFEKKYFFFKVR